MKTAILRSLCDHYNVNIIRTEVRPYNSLTLFYNKLKK